MKHLSLLVLLVATCGSAGAQTPITHVIFEHTTASSGLTYSLSAKDYNFGNRSGTIRNIQNATGILFPSQNFYYNSFVNGEVRIRRVNNSVTKGNKSLVWMESVEKPTAYNIALPYQDAMEVFLQGRTINQGTDNLFGNQGDGSGNNNNIERVDWLTPGGMKTANVDQAGFAILERGDDNQHDPFCIAAILDVDEWGNPTKYGNILRVASGKFGNIVSSSVTYSILRKEESETRLVRSSGGTQNRGGVFVSLKDLGISANRVVYGYSLFANDLPLSATPANLLNFADTRYFPTTTPANTGDGGLDLIAITGLFTTAGNAVVLPARLLSFTATQTNGAVKLDWEIAQAEEIRQIEIEDSNDGYGWKRYAVLAGSTRSCDAQSMEAGRRYYRLRLVSKDGNVNYSAVKTVMATKPGITHLLVHFSAKEMRLWFQQKAAQPVTVRIYDLQGRCIWNASFFGKAGDNQVQVSGIPLKGEGLLELCTPQSVIRRKVISQ